MWEVATDGQVPMTQRQVWRVPDGHVWIEGDNSVDSVDSREYGAVPAARTLAERGFRAFGRSYSATQAESRECHGTVSSMARAQLATFATVFCKGALARATPGAPVAQAGAQLGHL